jgi:NAD dependent epimerase/dehydratase family enzyme
VRGGAVVSDDGSPPGSRLFPFKLGMAGRTGGGRQWLSWISGADHTAAMLHVLATETLHGPVNLTAPNPVTNAEFAAALVRVLRRPAVVPIPNLALDLLLGKEMARETVTASRRALPAALEASGFTFRHADLDAALRVTAAR